MYTEQMSQGLSIAGAPIHPQSLAAASATVDMKLQESVDNSTFTDLAGTNVSITQLVQAGGNNRLATLEARAGQLSAGRRYLRALVTVGTAATQVCCIALGGESVSKPGSANDVTAVAQR